MSKREAEKVAEAEAPSEKKHKQQDEAASEDADAAVASVKLLEGAYRAALSAFKVDKTNKELRRVKSAAKNAWDAAVAATGKGEPLTCKDCSHMFLFQDRELYEKEGWDHTPTRCPSCNVASTDRLKDRSKRDSSGKNMCYDFQRGECTRGDRCKFSHDPNHGGNANKKAPPKPVCFAFRKGECKLGDQCGFPHTVEAATETTVQ